jgi:hypothetical protein
VTMPKGKNGAIPAKVRVAIDAMLDGADLATAAAKSGMVTARLRKYLTVPHIHKFAWHARRERLEALCLSTPKNLRDIILNAQNSMSRVAAIRQAEQIRRDDLVEAGEISTPPGMQIVIVQQSGQIETTIGPPGPLIEHEPLDEPTGEASSP